MRDRGRLNEMEARVIENWPDAGLFQHARLELAAVFARGGIPFEPRVPVPDCTCVRCRTMAVGGRRVEDVQEAEDAVEVLAGLPVDLRMTEASRWAKERNRLGRDVRIPAPLTLVLMAVQHPGAVRWGSTELGVDGLPPIPAARVDWERMVDHARAVSTVEVARRLGCGDPVRRGRELAVRCPLHEDKDPSLRIHEDGRRWYCDPCGEGGDSIRLHMRARSLDFVTAVGELVGESHA